MGCIIKHRNHTKTLVLYSKRFELINLATAQEKQDKLLKVKSIIEDFKDHYLESQETDDKIDEKAKKVRELFKKDKEVSFFKVRKDS